jgi:hypothetical protein
MDDFTARVSSRMSEFRRHAESLMARPNTDSTLKQEQERKRQAVTAKTERLRKRRLAKEAAEKEASGPKAVRRQKRKPRMKRY